MSCGQLDFLPTLCAMCGKDYCEDCQTTHGCQRDIGRRLPKCPLCAKAISLRVDEDENTAVERHIASGCTQGTQATVDKQRFEASRCSFMSGKKPCADVSLVKIKCARCLKLYCAKHRDESKHACEA